MKHLYASFFLGLISIAGYGQIVSIGTGTITSGQSPWETTKGYSYVQTIYLQSEILSAGNITSIEYYYGNASLSNNQAIEVYMGTVSRSSFSSTSDWEPIANLTNVFTGNVGTATFPGWITITLTNPFAYSNTGNLLIAVHENTPGSDGIFRFHSTNVGTNRVLYKASDISDPIPATPGLGALSSVIGNIKIHGLTLSGCLMPINISISSTTTTSALASWTAQIGGSVVSQYNYEVRTSGAAGSGSTGLVLSGNSPSTSVNLNGLLAGTNYKFYVRSDCGAASYSPWSAATDFATRCLPVTAFPWAENFDGVTIPAMPFCFTVLNENNDGDFWRTYTGYGNNGSQAAGIFTDFNGGANNDYLILPPMSLTGNQRFRFKARSESFNEPNDLEVLLSTTGDAPSDLTTTLMPLTVINSMTYITVPWMSLTSYTGPVYIAIRVPPGGLDGFRLFIDDMQVEDIPICNEPNTLVASDRTTTTTTISWKPPAILPTGYQVYYSTSDTLPNGNTVPVFTGITDTFAILTGLTHSTTYNVWVRSNCGVNGFSPWSDGISFITVCGPVNTPTAVETFSTAVPPNICWRLSKGKISGQTTFISNNSSGWLIDDFANISSPVNKSAKLVIYGDNCRDWLMTPTYDLGTGGKQLEFDIALTLYNSTTPSILGVDDRFYVVVSPDNGATWSVNHIRWELPYATVPNGGIHVVVDLPYTGLVKIGFYGESDYDNVYLDVFIDNVEVKLKPLPVTLVSFEGERRNNYNLLSWTTASEVNNKGFELQRSADGNRYSSLGFITSKSDNGSSNAALQYAYSDEKPLAGNGYYRLKQLDKDGKFTFSNIVLIKGLKSANVDIVNIYPNPVVENLNMIITAPTSEKIILVIFDMTGRLLMQQPAVLVSGDNNISIPTEKLAKGNYLLKVICTNGCEHPAIKFIKL